MEQRRYREKEQQLSHLSKIASKNTLTIIVSLLFQSSLQVNIMLGMHGISVITISI